MKRALVTIVAFAAISASAGCGSSAPAPVNQASTAPRDSVANRPSDPTMNTRTRAYVVKISGCGAAVALVRRALKRSPTVLDMADVVTRARNVCDNTRRDLAAANTDHFDDQAAEGFNAVDRYKSGLNAMLAYIDNPRPSKIIEARDKMQEGDVSLVAALHGINVRRHVYGLRAIRPAPRTTKPRR